MSLLVDSLFKKRVFHYVVSDQIISALRPWGYSFESDSAGW